MPSCLRMSAATGPVAVAVRASTVGPPSLSHGARNLEKCRAEVMTPLRDAMGFIHREQADGAAGGQEGKKISVCEPLWSGQHDARATVGDGLLCLARLLRREPTVQLHGGYPSFTQRIALVPHERDERRHHHGPAFDQQGRQLIAKRFASPCRHHGQGVFALQHTVDYLPLSGPQFA